MRSLFGGDTYESDNDEKLDRKFSYNYQVIKRMYPKASKLPEEEVRGIIRKYYQAPKGQEEQAIKDYIRQKEPDMNRTGKKLVNKYGSNAAANIDDYYHSLLQCQLAKISPVSRKYGLALGYGKEIYDYYKKKNHMSSNELIKDMQKDLHNNIYGSNIGKKYRNKPCQELLDEFRTENMRQEKIY